MGDGEIIRLKQYMKDNPQEKVVNETYDKAPEIEDRNAKKMIMQAGALACPPGFSVRSCVVGFVFESDTERKLEFYTTSEIGTMPENIISRLWVALGDHLQKMFGRQPKKRRTDIETPFDQ